MQSFEHRKMIACCSGEHPSPLDTVFTLVHIESIAGLPLSSRQSAMTLRTFATLHVLQSRRQCVNIAACSIEHSGGFITTPQPRQPPSGVVFSSGDLHFSVTNSTAEP